MRSRTILPLVLVAATYVWAQPYAPEFLPETPWYEQMPVAEAQSQPRTTPARSDAAQRLIDETRAVMAADDADAREDGETVASIPNDYVLSAVDYVRVFVWLCVIIATIVLLGAALRRWGRKTPLLAGAHLGKVLGRLYLDRSASLHFVETAGQVLVIGVAQNHVSLLATFGKEAFVAGADAPSPAPSADSGHSKDFQRQFAATSARMRAASPQVSGDTEIDALQADIARLQRHLKEEAREFSE